MAKSFKTEVEQQVGKNIEKAFINCPDSIETFPNMCEDNS
jgi:hypothetical protein